MEKALRQYCGRLHAERTGAYLPRALQEVLAGTLGVFGDRLGRLLFKLVVEHTMTNHLPVSYTHLEHFEGGAKNMGNTNRTIAFQVPEELFDRLKDYLAKHGLKQKDFILGLIERELNDAVDAE